MVAPITAHAAFDKASQYFGIELRKVPVGPDLRADVAADARALIDDQHRGHRRLGAPRSRTG